jgi:hypothetical protein
MRNPYYKVPGVNTPLTVISFIYIPINNTSCNTWPTWLQLGHRRRGRVTGYQRRHARYNDDNVGGQLHRGRHQVSVLTWEVGLVTSLLS